jgi:predicted transcriptional regulator
VRLGRANHLRQVLYSIRRNRPYKPGLPLLVISEVLGTSIETAQFTLRYLRGKKLIEITDDDDTAFTVAGVDYVEASLPRAVPGRSRGPAGLRAAR